jgi:hypothetical protein
MTKFDLLSKFTKLWHHPKWTIRVRIRLYTFIFTFMSILGWLEWAVTK